MIDTNERIGFRDYCPSCDWALHVCFNCEFFAPEYHNQCRETQASPVRDKARFNFCEYFHPAISKLAVNRPGGGEAARPSPSSTSAARAQLDALFRKKP
jgi:hypothetical protein